MKHFFYVWCSSRNSWNSFQLTDLTSNQWNGWKKTSRNDSRRLSWNLRIRFPWKRGKPSSQSHHFQVKQLGIFSIQIYGDYFINHDIRIPVSCPFSGVYPSLPFVGRPQPGVLWNACDVGWMELHPQRVRCGRCGGVEPRGGVAMETWRVAMVTYFDGSWWWFDFFFNIFVDFCGPYFLNMIQSDLFPFFQMGGFKSTN